MPTLYKLQSELRRFTLGNSGWEADLNPAFTFYALTDIQLPFPKSVTILDKMSSWEHVFPLWALAENLLNKKWILILISYKAEIFPPFPGTYLAYYQNKTYRKKIYKTKVKRDNPAMEKTKDRVLTTDEAIQYLKISRPTYFKCIRLGSINAIKVGNGWRVLESELNRFLRSGRERTRGLSNPVLSHPSRIGHWSGEGCITFSLLFVSVWFCSSFSLLHQR